MKKTLSIDELLSWGPCEDYDTRGKCLAATGGKDNLTIAELLVLNIPKKDIIWIFLHEYFFTREQLINLACDFAGHVLPIFKSKYLNNNPIIPLARFVTLATVESAARLDAGAWAVAEATTRAVAMVAAWATAESDHAGSAARAAAEAETKWQLEKIKEYLQEQYENIK